MAKKKNKKKKKKKAATRTSSRSSTRSSTTKPKFPYTSVPNALRQFLRLVPDRPKPPKIDMELLKSWGIGDSNASTIVRVLKAVKLVDGSGQPTDKYNSFMLPEVGPAVLGSRIRETYAKFFEASHEPFKQSDTDLRRLFNIHSGGSDSTLRLQSLTFKTLCEFATFDGDPPASAPSPLAVPPAGSQLNPPPPGRAPTATVHIDLHIHLPENKTTRDYQGIIEDIGRYIYHREDLGDE